MEFILLIFINIIMGAVFYIILRIKLEKYATDYREKRLKREMDEIIFEFNETAERNISILENRIEYLKKILEKPSKVGNIDYSVGDTEETKNNSYVSKDDNISSLSDKSSHGRSVKERSTITPTGFIQKNKSMDSGLISKYFLKIKCSLGETYNTMLKHKHNNHKLDSNHDLSLNQDKSFNSMIKIQSENMIGSDQLIEQNNILINTDANHTTSKQKEDTELSETELGEMFFLSDDKYLLISDLYNKGYTSEIISRCSGIPIGEIQLVLDLNNSQ